jgi:hypothetical protein
VQRLPVSLLLSPAMRRPLAIVLGVAAIGLGLTACAGSGGGRYEETGLNITFKIPRGFHVAHDITVTKSAGASAVDEAGIALDTNNLIIVQRYNLNTTINAGNLAKYKGAVDKVVGSLAGRKVSGRQVEHGGLPGYEYVIKVANPPQGESRMAVLFDNNVEYLVNCQSTPDKRDKIEKGCRTVLDSIQTL